jgi:hypothetical protein
VCAEGTAEQIGFAPDPFDQHVAFLRVVLRRFELVAELPYAIEAGTNLI